MEVLDHDGFVVVEGRRVRAGGDRIKFTDGGAGLRDQHADGAILFL